MTRALVFRVYGQPKPQGSKRAYPNRATGRPILTEAAGAALKTWREDVKHAAIDALDGAEPFTGGVALRVHFILSRPRSHYRTGLTTGHLLRAGAPTYPARPDLDKLTRGLCDALTAAGLWHDDSQLVHLHATKGYPAIADTPARPTDTLAGARVWVTDAVGDTEGAVA